MDTKYAVRIKVLVEPVWFNRHPTIEIGVNGQFQTETIVSETWFEFNLSLPKSICRLEVKYLDKQLHDTNLQTGKDTAIIIKKIIINDIQSDKFVWQGIYRPDYPAHYIKQQKELGVELAQEITNSTYMGWNGVWTLDIGIPAYTWIHNIENLGWIYE